MDVSHNAHTRYFSDFLRMVGQKLNNIILMENFPEGFYLRWDGKKKV